MKKIIFIALLFINLNFLFAIETQIDSLKNRLEKLSRTEKVDTLISLAKLHIADSSEKAMAYCEQASGLAKRLDYKQGEALAAFYYGRIYRKTNEYDQALKHQHNALKIFQDFKNDNMNAQSIIEIGLNYFAIPDMGKAINYFNQALNIYIQLNDSTGISIAYYNLGRCYRKSGDLDAALSHSLKSLSYEEENNHNALNTISIVYGMIGNLEKSFEHQERVLKIREGLGLNDKVIDSLNNLGLISRLMGKPKHSLQYYLRSVELAEEIGKKTGLHRVLNNVGVLYDRELDDPEKALQYYQKSLKISKEINDDFDTANTLINIGYVQSKLKRYNKAATNIEKGLNLAKQINATEIIQNGYITLSQHYERLRDFKQSLKNYKFYTTFKDSILNQTTNDRIAEMQIKYETEKKEKENQAYKLQLEKARKERWQLTAGIIIILLITFIIYFRYRVKKKTALLLEELVTKRTFELQQKINELEQARESLHNAHEELKKHREHLEELVKERTAELEEKNKKLEEFNELFVDREFRIKELKEKVKELEEK